MLKNESDKDFTVMIFRDTANPRILRFPNDLIKTWSWLIPTIIFSLCIAAAAWVFYTKESAKNNISSLYEKEINRLENQSGTASSEKASLKERIVELEDQLERQRARYQEFKSGKRIPYSMDPADFPKEMNIRAANFRSEVNAFGGLTLKFDLENTQTNRKSAITGNLIAIAQNGSNITVFPTSASSESELIVDPSKGDSFSFRSFRPSIVKFENLRNPRRAINYRIFLYDDTGIPIFYTNWSGKAGL